MLRDGNSDRLSPFELVVSGNRLTGDHDIAIGGQFLDFRSGGGDFRICSKVSIESFRAVVKPGLKFVNFGPIPSIFR